jgi:putative aldouronate transport system permease protein
VDYRDVEDSIFLEIFSNISSRTIKGAAVMITITPVLCVYPFLQKYFTKGIMVGALKA